MEKYQTAPGRVGATVADVPPMGQARDAHLKRTILSSLIGTTIEYYDFLAYALAAATVFGPLFFPLSDPAVGILLSFATFTAGFLARPLGAVVFGHFGDRLGRRRTLIIVLVLMGAATTGIGLLPTYEQLGLLAPTLLVSLRLLQGFSAGGEFGGAALLIVEHAPVQWRGFYGSFVPLGVAVGSTLATIAFAALNGLSNEAFLSWGWRIPFLISALLVVFGLVIRLSVRETPAFLEEQKQKRATRTLPIVEVLRSHWKETLLSAGILFGYISFAYVITTYTISYGVTVVGLGRQTMLNAQLVGNVAAFVTIPLFGHLSDKLGRKPVIIAGAISVMIMSYVIFAALDSGSPVFLFIGFLLASPLAQAIHAPTGALFPELFGTGGRYSGVSLGYQFGAVLGGGFAPTIAALLYANFKNANAIATYTMLCAVVTIVCTLLLPSKRHPLSPEEITQSQAGSFELDGNIRNE